MYQLKYVLVDEHNQNVLGDFFSEIKPHYNKYWEVKEKGLCGLYSMHSLTPILKCEWEKILITEKGFIVFKSGHSGWYDLNGDCILPCIYKKISTYDLCLIVQKATSQVGAFNYDGTPILTCSWNKIIPYSKALIAYRNKKSTAFDYSGKLITR